MRARIDVKVQSRNSLDTKVNGYLRYTVSARNEKVVVAYARLCERGKLAAGWRGNIADCAQLNSGNFAVDVQKGAMY